MALTKAHTELFDELLEKHPVLFSWIYAMGKKALDKMHDYAGDEDPLANLRECADWGDRPSHGCAARMGDKWSRFKRFLKTGILKVEDEKIEDTLLDLSIYPALFVALLDEERDGR